MGCYYYCLEGPNASTSIYFAEQLIGDIDETGMGYKVERPDIPEKYLQQIDKLCSSS